MTQAALDSGRRVIWQVAVAAALIVTFAAPALAEQKSSLHVRRIFTESAATAGFLPIEDISADCLWGLMYIDLSTQAGRAQLALVMQAKVQNLVLARVDYSKNPNGTCSVYGIHVE